MQKGKLVYILTDRINMPYQKYINEIDTIT